MQANPEGLCRVSYHLHQWDAIVKVRRRSITKIFANTVELCRRMGLWTRESLYLRGESGAVETFAERTSKKYSCRWRSKITARFAVIQVGCIRMKRWDVGVDRLRFPAGDRAETTLTSTKCKPWRETFRDKVLLHHGYSRRYWAL